MEVNKNWRDIWSNEIPYIIQNVINYITQLLKPILRTLS